MTHGIVRTERVRIERATCERRRTASRELAEQAQYTRSPLLLLPNYQPVAEEHINGMGRLRDFGLYLSRMVVVKEGDRASVGMR